MSDLSEVGLSNRCFKPSHNFRNGRTKVARWSSNRKSSNLNWLNGFLEGDEGRRKHPDFRRALKDGVSVRRLIHSTHSTCPSVRPSIRPLVSFTPSCVRWNQRPTTTAIISNACRHRLHHFLVFGSQPQTLCGQIFSSNSHIVITHRFSGSSYCTGSSQSLRKSWEIDHVFRKINRNVFAGGKPSCHGINGIRCHVLDAMAVAPR